MDQPHYQSSTVEKLLLASWAPNTLLASWAPNTQAMYSTLINKWMKYCQEHNLNPHQADYKEGMCFLAQLFEQNHKHGVIAVARSALSAVLYKRNGLSFGQDPNVSKMMKGIFKLRPTLPKYVVMYDPDIILNYMNTLPDNSSLSLELLTKKLVMLLCLLRGQRSQSIHANQTNYMKFSNNKYICYIPKILKTTKPGKHLAPSEFYKFPNNSKLCVVSCIDEYMKRTNPIRNIMETRPVQLILSYAPPHDIVGSATIARYAKLFLHMSGIDVTVFTAHSTRSSSVSKVESLGLSLKDIQKAAGRLNGSTFRKHYKLPIQRNFGSTLLECHS